MMNNFKVYASRLSIFFVIIFIFMISTACSKIFTIVDTDDSGLRKKKIKSVIVEDFEKDTGWEVEACPEHVAKMKPVPVLQLKFIEGGPEDLNAEHGSADSEGVIKNHCMGVGFQLSDSGCKSVHIIPPQPIVVPGRVHGIAIWVHGRSTGHSLDIWLKDFTGKVHIIQFGAINFTGWRHLEVKIPEHIPQEIDSHSQANNLRIERLVLLEDSIKYEDPKSFFFFDQLKVFCEK